MSNPDLISGHRAEPPRSPAATPSVVRARTADALYRQDREREQRRSLLRGLLWLALLVVIFSIARAGLHRAFVPGWWRP